MNNNTTTPKQDYFLSIDEAKQVALESPSSIWKTDDVILLLNRIVKVKELYVEVPTEPIDMEQSIEMQEKVKGMFDLLEDISTSVEAVESSVENINVDDSNIEYYMEGNGVYVNNIDIDGKAIALSDLHTLRQEINYLKEKIQDFVGKEVSNG